MTRWLEGGLAAERMGSSDEADLKRSPIWRGETTISDPRASLTTPSDPCHRSSGSRLSVWREGEDDDDDDDPSAIPSFDRSHRRRRTSENRTDGRARSRTTTTTTKHHPYINWPLRCRTSPFLVFLHILRTLLLLLLPLLCSVSSLHSGSRSLPSTGTHTHTHADRARALPCTHPVICTLLREV